MKAIKISILTTILFFAVASGTAVNTLADEQKVLTLDEGQSSDYVDINIDGEYYDWDDKPHTPIHYSWDTHNENHKGALYRDEEFVYLHLKMSDYGYSSFNGYNYRFTIDGVDSYVVAVPPEGSQLQVGQNPLVIRNQNGYTLINGAEGMMTRQNNKSDEWELKIPLSFFTDSPETVRTIKFFSSNIGPQELVATGTPTLPFVVAGGGLLIATVGYTMSKKRKAK